MRTMILAAVAAIATLATANAADLGRTMPTYAPPMPAYNWSGFYLGGHAGGAAGSSSYSLDFLDLNLATGTVSNTAIVGGVHAGYNAQFGAVVAGVEADATFGGPRMSSEVFGGTISGKNAWMASVTGKLGFLVDPRLMIYGKAGVAAAKFNFNVADEATWSHTKLAPTVGVGVDYLITRNISLGAEYRYTRFGKVTHDFTELPGLSLTNDLNDHRFMVKGAWHAN